MQRATEIFLEKVIIKQLKLSETDKLVPIYLDAFHGMNDPKLTKQWLQCNFKAFPQKICFGAWYNDSLLGYVVWVEKGGFRTEAVWELEQIAVLTIHRRKGVGTKLIRDSLTEIQNYLNKRGANLKLVIVTTGVTNESRRLYERVLGAERQGVIIDFYEGDEQIMIARFNRGNKARADKDDLLRLEYSECQAGYNNRDRIVPDEVQHVGFMFTVLTALLIFTANLLQVSPVWFRLFAGIIGVLGVFLLVGFLVDIQSNLSCKRALRLRSERIENLLSPETSMTNIEAPLRIWRAVIPKRDKSCEERKLKRIFSLRLSEGEGNYFVWAVRVALVFWIALVAITILYAHIQ